MQRPSGEVQVSVLQEHTEGQHDWHIMGKEYEQDEFADAG